MSDGRCLVNMKAVLPLIGLTLIGLADCIVKRQCSCFNARHFAATACQGITDFENLFAVSGSTIAPFGSVLDTIAERSDSRTVIDEICASQSCFSRLDTLYSCCTVDNSGGNGLTRSFSDVARNYACNRPSSSSTDYCATSISNAETIMVNCASSSNQCNSRCRADLIQLQSCCVISYYQLLTNETQQRILTQDIWSTCSITPPSKCTNSLCFPPTFTTIGQDAIVTNGGVHTVTCRADGEGQIQYELQKEENEAFGYRLDGTFNLENVNGQDGGQYRCVARNQCGIKMSDYFTIYVQPRMTVTSLSNTTLIDSEQIDLQCTGNGYPIPFVQWVLDDTVIKNGTQLVITNVTVNDSGVYYCMGLSMVGSANASVSINIIPAPSPTASSTVEVSSTQLQITLSSSDVVDTTISTEPTVVLTDTNEEDDNEELTIILAVVIPLVIVILLIFVIICLLCDVRSRKRKIHKQKKTDKRPLLRNDPLSMVTLKEAEIKILDAENPLSSSNAHSTGGGLVGISEAIELEEQSAHDSAHSESEPEKDQEEVKDREIHEPGQQETITNEPEELEIKDDKQEVAKATDELENNTTNEEEINKQSDKPERQPTEFKLPKRSSSVAEKARIFEEKLSSPILPLHSPRKPKIVLPTAEPMVSSQEQLIDLQDPPLPLAPPLELSPSSESPPSPPSEPPPSPPIEPHPPGEQPPPTPPESLPPPPSEPPPSPPIEPHPPPVEPDPLAEPPPPTPPKSPPPSSEPPLLEVSQMEPPPQAADDIQQRLSTMPASESKRLMQKVTEKKRSATVVKVSIKSNPLTLNALDQLIEKAVAAGATAEDDDSKIDNLLAKEFHSIPMNFPRQEDLPKGCAVKNRYNNVKPNAHSRVMLQSTGDELSTYINANYIRGLDGKSPAYIATQGPTDATMDDFWRMIWEQKVAIIVMLTGLVENGKRKCNHYWPECYGEDNIQYGSIVVINNLEEKGAGFITTYLTIYHLDNPLKQREVTHFWFKAWPDFGVPETTASILALRKRVQGQRGAKTSPIVVHCSAGVGRTGVFCAVDMGVQQYDRDSMVNPLQYLSQMRQDRGGMIQKTKQYEFVCQVLLDYIKSRKG